MPVVVIPNCFLNPQDHAPGFTDCRVVSRVWAEILDELLREYPVLGTRFDSVNGKPAPRWFDLFREVNDEDLRFTPDLVLGEDERLALVNAVGC